MDLKFSKIDIEKMERFFRIHLINSLSGYKSSHLIGTINQTGQTNLAIFNSVIHVGANPPLMGVLFRTHSIPRHTYENIKSNGTFTINHVPISLIKNGHQTSSKYDANISEFGACGFTPWHIEGFSAPFVEESKIKIGLSFVEEHLIHANKTILVVGQIEHLFVPKQAVAVTGHLQIEDCDSAIVCGLDTYFKSEKIFRLSYARPNQELKEID